MGIWALEVVDGQPKGSPQSIKQNLNGMHPLGVTQEGAYYYWLPPGDGDVYMATLDPETGEVVIPPAKVIRSYEGFNRRPDFSPDGKYLAYVSRRPKGSDDSRILVIYSLETGEERELQTDIPLVLWGPSAPRWSPDGRSILILATVTDSANEKRNGFHQIDVETGAVTPVVLDDELGSIFGRTAPVWSPDGSKIFFHRRNGGIRIYDLEAKREWKPELQWPEGGSNGDAGLALSPDGRQLAFTINFDNERVIYIAPSNGEIHEITRLRTDETVEGRGLTWTPDGRYLLFLGKHEDGLCELRRISVEGGKSQNLGLKVAAHTYLSIHPDGRRIAFTGAGPTPGAEVWAMENFLPGFAADK
jgi:Tol biopolymer transport system component